MWIGGHVGIYNGYISAQNSTATEKVDGSES